MSGRPGSSRRNDRERLVRGDVRALDGGAQVWKEVFRELWNAAKHQARLRPRRQWGFGLGRT
jgi:hypothetical protein